jgi:hypothetical protein
VSAIVSVFAGENCLSTSWGPTIADAVIECLSSALAVVEMRRSGAHRGNMRLTVLSDSADSHTSRNHDKLGRLTERAAADQMHPE